MNFEKIRVLKVAKTTTEIELIGIIMAATTGAKFPVIAKPNPMILYKKLMVKAAHIKRMEILENCKNSGKF